MEFWAEVTSVAHGHGGPGWELGTCLWSPTTNKSGHNRYGIMREPEPGEPVLHMVSGVDAASPKTRYLFGRSTIAKKAATVREGPPLPGDWAGHDAYFRIELSGFQEASPKPRLDEIERGLSSLILNDLGKGHEHYPYMRYRNSFRGRQGAYLARLTPILADAFSEILGAVSVLLPSTDETPDALPSEAELAAEYAEGERSAQERAFFRRSVKLRRDAISAHGCVCAACGFDFEARYGELGQGFIEIHHLSPLGERSAPEKTTIDQVAPLCANCHRIVHRRSPPLTVPELKALLDGASADLYRQ